jgi:hypothetical protein
MKYFMVAGETIVVALYTHMKLVRSVTLQVNKKAEELKYLNYLGRIYVFMEVAIYTP